ncbi:MAG: bifunctional oligoribonuclease/PAP phosphatase NrnA [Treponema sp.]|jgi:phosphoesterase RecJ-like protein|nr:bifunctional oligoribonuclease/PAP phosphatase NrnA [Treponema sp.]
MSDEVFNFLKRKPSVILTTHEVPDADGLGAEIALAQVCRELGKNCRIINAVPMAERYYFMDPQREVETLDKDRDKKDFEQSVLIIIDCPDEYQIGAIKEFVTLALDVLVIDHHEIAPLSPWKAYIDSSASSTCELVAEIAEAAGIKLNPVSSAALFAGISYDTGSFAFPKTTIRTFKAALKLIEDGVNPYSIYHELNETSAVGALLLRKQVFSTLEIKNKGRVAVQILRKEDLKTTKTRIEDAETFINIPLMANEILISVMIKEKAEGAIRCSLRSKGTINVSKIAQSFGGGGHVTASGFRSSLSIEETLSRLLDKITLALDES